jgi:hypothetical protein
MKEKIKITEKEFFEKLCADCAALIGEDCYYVKEKRGCFGIELMKRFDVFEIIPEKSALDKFDEHFKNMVDKLSCSYSEMMILKEYHDQAIKELQEKLNEKI